MLDRRQIPQPRVGAQALEVEPITRPETTEPAEPAVLFEEEPAAPEVADIQEPSRRAADKEWWTRLEENVGKYWFAWVGALALFATHDRREALGPADRTLEIDARPATLVRDLNVPLGRAARCPQAVEDLLKDCFDA